MFRVPRILAASLGGVAHGAGQELFRRRQFLSEDGAVGLQRHRLGDVLRVLAIPGLEEGLDLVLMFPFRTPSLTAIRNDVESDSLFRWFLRWFYQMVSRK